MRFALAFICLAGCASDPPIESYEPVCARQCLAIHAECISHQLPGATGGCDQNARLCLATCPSR